MSVSDTGVATSTGGGHCGQMHLSDGQNDQLVRMPTAMSGTLTGTLQVTV